MPRRYETVDTIADLTALSSSVRRDGLIVYVKAFDANGYGGGHFRWVEDSEQVTDGGVTFVPDDLTTVATETVAAASTTLTYGNMGDTNSFRQLRHGSLSANPTTQIAFGTVRIQYADSASEATSYDLHGHASTGPRRGDLRNITTVTAGTPGVLTSNGGHGLSAGWRVFFSGLPSGSPTSFSMPDGLEEGRIYYVTADNLTALNFSVAETLGGSSIAFDDVYNGTLRMANFHKRDHPLLDHESGQLWGDGGFRVRNLIQSNTNTHVTTTSRTTQVNYDYITGPGRWIRVLEPGSFVTPAMFGGIPDDDSVDNGNAINCAMNFIGLYDQSAIKHLHFDALYYDKQAHEIYQGVKITGLGKNTVCHRYLGDQGGGQGGVIDMVNEVHETGTASTNHDLNYLLRSYRPTWIQYDLADAFEFRDYNLDGNIENNLYFLDDDVAWDIEPVDGNVSQSLRESPGLSGITIVEQSRRIMKPNMRWGVHHVTIANMAASCLLTGGFMEYSDCRFGNSMSGRILYGGMGMGDQITIFGYTRSSYWSPYSGHFSNVLWEDIDTPNPWPENTVDPDFFANRTVGYYGEEQLQGTVGIERYGAFHTKLDGFAMDMGTVGVSAFNTNGNGLHVSNGVIKGPSEPIELSRLLSQNQGAQEGGSSGPILSNIWVYNRSSLGWTLCQETLGGYFKHALWDNIHIEDQYIDGVRLTGDITDGEADVDAYWCAVNMDPNPGGAVPDTPLQKLVFRDVYDDTLKFFIVTTEGGTTADAVPTEIYWERCHIANIYNQIAKTSAGGVDWYPGKLKLNFKDTIINLWDPGETGRGGHTGVNAVIPLTVIMENCKTLAGRTSETNRLVTFTATAGTTVSITNASPAVVTDTAHGMSNGARVQFESSGGTLPTGMTAGVIYYVINKDTDTYQFSLKPGGAAVNTSSAGSGTFKRAKHDSEVLTAITNTNTYIDIPTNLMWTPMVYSVTPVSANAVTRGISATALSYPKSSVTPAQDDYTRTRLRITVGTLSNGDVLTYRIQGAVAPMRNLDTATNFN